ncbi:hypothetical protein FM113_09450 [Leucobacter sp. 7(1)]|uniref:HtaA domain-containing protein n=1 Tax=Leucobacter sp. 7(1) TaxID=1255613 RepID=UPI00097F58BE|nr:HtaA domain-containing protein [Leucobacter sp. 7(1)]SJN10565.1 hypothetical protein FM113_09450 [Leucobacter sp. 7(1)]
MCRTEAALGPLSWGIKDSLIAYVLGMSDGSVRLAPPAAQTPTGFRFAPDPTAVQAPTDAPHTLRFAGTVTLQGHGGMLRIEIADPWLVAPAVAPDGTGDAEAAAPWQLTIHDPFEPGERLVFAEIDRVEEGPDGTLNCVGTRLAADGADLFFAGPYSRGTLLHNPVVAPADRRA